MIIFLLTEESGDSVHRVSLHFGFDFVLFLGEDASFEEGSWIVFDWVQVYFALCGFGIFGK